MIIAQTQREGLSEEAARQKVFMVDRFGLLTDKMPNLLPFQTKLVQKRENLSDWDTDSDVLSLLDVVRNVKPDILIGVSGQTGLFTEEIIREMHKHCPRPIVMPLSNPTSRVEATPQDIIAWTEGNALVATGSPFNPVVWKDKIYPIAQCNNAFIFPGIGLGVIASGASRITDEMLMSASETLAQYSPLVLNGEGLVLPELKDIQKVSAQLRLRLAKWRSSKAWRSKRLLKLCNKPLTIISGKPNTATTAVPPSKPAPGSEGYRAISLSLFQISSILGSGE